MKEAKYLLLDYTEDNAPTIELNEKEFYKSLKQNRSIAKEYGDDVEKWHDLKNYFVNNKEASADVNGFTFMKTHSKKTYKEYK